MGDGKETPLKFEPMRSILDFPGVFTVAGDPEKYKKDEHRILGRKKRNRFWFRPKVYLMLSLKLFPAENFGERLAAILIVCPVLGFRPVLAFLLTVEKVPKPVKVILVPSFFSSFLSESTNPLIASFAWLLVILADFATFSTSSAFVIESPLLG